MYVYVPFYNADVQGCVVGDALNVSTEGIDCDCCYKEVSCQVGVCGVTHSRLIISTPEGKTMLRHYVIPEDRVIGYIIQGENQAANSNTSHCGCNVQI